MLISIALWLVDFRESVLETSRNFFEYIFFENFATMSTRANDSKGYYQMLGLQPGASIDDVKKAYKKKQMELHPSGPTRRKIRDTAEYKTMSKEKQVAKEAELDEQIAKVNEAYKVLGDENKKKEYDSGTGEFSQFGNMGGFGGFEDIVSHFTGRRAQKGKPKVKDIVTEIKITYKDVFLGKKSKYRVKVAKICKVCDGKGVEAGKDVSRCGKCKGSGTVYAELSLGGIMRTTQRIDCPDCEGKGFRGPKCCNCGGNKTVQDSKIIEVCIMPGVKDGEQLVYNEQGSEYPGYDTGDLVFIINVAEDPKCQRIGDDFVCVADIDILTALGGGVLYFDHPDGRKLAVKVMPFRDFDSAIMIPNEGFTSATGRKGNLYIKPHVLVNSGLDRAKLSEYIKPLISKPYGEYTSVNSTLDKIPEAQHRSSYHNGDGARGFSYGMGVDPREFFSDFF